MGFVPVPEDSVAGSVRQRCVLGLLLVLLVFTTGILLGVPGQVQAVTEVQPASGVIGAGVDDFTFASYHVEYLLDRDVDGRSVLHTVESFVAVFPPVQNRGMRRAIPHIYNGEPIEISNISVTDETGAPRPFDVETDGEFTIVTSAADTFVEGEQTYVFSYEQSNVTRYFADTGVDEWYWDTNGTGWNQPFSAVEVTVRLGTGLAGAMVTEPLCYQGWQGSTNRCEIRQTQSDEFIATYGQMSAGQNITVGFGFAQGTFEPRNSSYFGSWTGYVQLLAFLAALVPFGYAIRARRTTLADAPGRPTIIAEYTPPSNLSVMTAALLLGRRRRAMAAQILEFAVQKRLRIIESEASGFLAPRRNYRLELLDPGDTRGGEGKILRALFGSSLQPGSIRELTRTDTKLSLQLYKVVQGQNETLVTAGYRRKVGRKTLLPLIGLSVAMVTIFIFGIVMIIDYQGAFVPFLIIAAAMVIATITVSLLLRVPLTQKGAETRDHLVGLKRYIQLAEADRLRMLQSPSGALREVNLDTGNRDVVKVYEELLPYAVVFGLEKAWSFELSRRYADQSPEWYLGTGAFNGALFATSIATMTTALKSSYSGSSSSSSAGGSGGGGFSGGGGGGGGGGGV